MSTDTIRIPNQEPRHDVEVEYGPDVPLAERLRRAREALAEAG